ncbi:MAG: metallopeptidase TldD-related protein [Planctomycetota bacterium]
MNRTEAKRLATLMTTEAERARDSIRSPGHPRPYFVSYLIRDEERWTVKARFGAITHDSRRHRRPCFCDVRVGSYKSDHVQDGGLVDSSTEDESYSCAFLPFEGDRKGIQHSLWRLAETRYREAAESYAQKKASQLTYLDRNRQYRAFEKLPPIQSVKVRDLPEVDEEYWRSYVKKASALVRRYPSIKSSSVRFSVMHQTKVYVSTEGSTQIENESFWSLECYLWLLSEQGDAFPWTISKFVRDPSELPDAATFHREIRATIQKLEKLAASPRIRAYAGPVLLDPIPAGLLVHEALGHRLEGNRMLSTGEGQTFRDSMNQPILPEFLSIVDEPGRAEFEGQSLVGHYSFDDEGCPAQDVTLVEGGVLRNFLTSRAPIDKRHRSNGHARNESYERPISRMGVTRVESHDGLSDAAMKKELIAEIEAQGLPFGIRILHASGGETRTESYDFQAFLGEINLAAKVYPDGREEWVRGVDFVGTPLNATRSIIAAGNRVEVDNAYCGAESGWVPVSTICPSLLVAHLELQAKSDAPYTQFAYPMPWEPEAE